MSAKPVRSHGASAHGPDCMCGRCQPFAKENAVALKHGARRSDLALSQEPRVAELVESIVATQPVSHPADEGACWRLALAYRRAELAARALDAADSELAEHPLAAYRDGADFLGRLRQDHAGWLRLAGKIGWRRRRRRRSRAGRRVRPGSCSPTGGARRWSIVGWGGCSRGRWPVRGCRGSAGTICGMSRRLR